MSRDPSFLLAVMLQLLRALPVTLFILVVSAVCATAAACLLTALRRSRSAGLRAGADGWMFVFRGTPLLVQLLMVYYGLAAVPFVRHSALWLAFRSPIFCTCLALTCCCSAYIAEVLRGALAVLPAGEIEAARACGMPEQLLFARVVLPTLLRNALPAYSNEIVMMVKSTSLASIVTVMDITGAAQQIIASTYRTLDVFCCAALLYLLINGGAIALLVALERRLGIQSRSSAGNGHDSADRDRHP